MRCSSFGPTPTAARQRRRSWRSEIDSSAGRAAGPPPCHGMRLPDGLVHQRVRFTGRSRDERLEPVERGPRCRGFPEEVRQAGQVAPEVGARDVLVDQLVGGHPDETAEHTRAQPHPDDRAPAGMSWYVDAVSGTEQPGRLTEHTTHLGAAMGHVPLRQGPVADLLDPDRRARAASAGVGARST